MNQVLPKISIVTPSFNQGAFIEDALLSLKQQNYPYVDHIVVDGASTDDTVEILRRYSGRPGWEHLHWISEPDHGQSDALNKGFRMATGPSSAG
jgi:glycosyltransferase involved in cell wall biosynthesis